jgi:hypothetical protein
VVLDPVPFAGPGREVADVDLKSELVGELLQLDLPESRAVAVRAARVGGDRQAGRVGVALASEVLPPAADAMHSELARIVLRSRPTPSLRRRPQPPATFVKLAHQESITLRDSTLIQHTTKFNTNHQTLYITPPQRPT